MSQNLRMFQNKYAMDGHSIDLCIDDLQFSNLRKTDLGATVILECTVAANQQSHPKVDMGKVPSLHLQKHYAQILGPAVLLENVQILETGEDAKTLEGGATVAPHSRVVLSATNLPIHGWGKAVGYREI